MAENKTQKTNADVTTFINGVDYEEKKDRFELPEMMKPITGKETKMWEPSIY